MQSDLDAAALWCKQNSLLLNEVKTVALAIGHKSVIPAQLPQFSINGVHIEYARSARNLGVHFDEHATFKPHIDRISRTAGRRLANFGRIRDLMPTATLKKSIESLVLAALTYVISAAYGLPPVKRSFNVSRSSRIGQLD